MHVAPDNIPPALREAIELYFDALYLCDIGMLSTVFHPAAHLFDADEGRIFVDPIASYKDTILRRTSPASQAAPREDDVIFADLLSDTAATAKVRVRIHDNRFVDHLMFAFDGTRWRIVAKLWHLEEGASDKVCLETIQRPTRIF